MYQKITYHHILDKIKKDPSLSSSSLFSELVPYLIDSVPNVCFTPKQKYTLIHHLDSQGISRFECIQNGIEGIVLSLNKKQQQGNEVYHFSSDKVTGAEFIDLLLKCNLDKKINFMSILSHVISNHTQYEFPLTGSDIIKLFDASTLKESETSIEIITSKSTVLKVEPKELMYLIKQAKKDESYHQIPLLLAKSNSKTHLNLTSDMLMDVFLNSDLSKMDELKNTLAILLILNNKTQNLNLSPEQLLQIFLKSDPNHLNAELKSYPLYLVDNNIASELGLSHEQLHTIFSKIPLFSTYSENTLAWKIARNNQSENLGYDFEGFYKLLTSSTSGLNKTDSQIYLGLFYLYNHDKCHLSLQEVDKIVDFRLYKTQLFNNILLDDYHYLNPKTENTLNLILEKLDLLPDEVNAQKMKMKLL